ncbi:peptide methionine sulfoxide reductase [Achromatium sp. WMS2]|nr:peptide methionine sulfoxide reductase [Achromatium sp. WMS2]
MASDKHEVIVLGMGCFWGAEKRLAKLPGVIDTEVGYAGGDFSNPTYRKVLDAEYNHQGRNHTEVVKLIFDPEQTNVTNILAEFWQSHDPTQGNRQGNDVGSNYRSAIYYTNENQRQVAQQTRDIYQQALTAAKYTGTITTEIAPLQVFYPAEEYHQDYLQKNPNGYCGLGGIGVAFPTTDSNFTQDIAKTSPVLDGNTLNFDRQLIMFEATDCQYCKQFNTDIASNWQATVPLAHTFSTQAPSGWTLAKSVFVSPTLVLFSSGKEVSRYTGYNGDKQRFWDWLGQQLLTPEQRRIAYTAGTEPPFTGSLLDHKGAGTYVDPVTGAPLFRSETKFHSGTGWPSFFAPVPGALTLIQDNSLGMRRIEVRSASSGIHLGHVFNDGPPPTGQRFCINSAVLKFIPDK